MALLGASWTISLQPSQSAAPFISDSFRRNAFSRALTDRKNKLNSPSSVTLIVGMQPFSPVRRTEGEFVSFIPLTTDMHRFFPLRSYINSNESKASASKTAGSEMNNDVQDLDPVAEDIEEEMQEDDDVDWDNKDIEDEMYDDDELIAENDAFGDDILEEEGESIDDIALCDVADGHGVNLSQTKWGEKALVIARGVLDEFGTNFSLYGFKVSLEGRIYVRIDKLSDKYGSPSIVEIESFSTLYGSRLEEAGQQGLLPNNLDLEVSSPGAERVVEVPNELLRFKDLPMFVRYIEDDSVQGSSGQEVQKDAVLELESLEIESGKSIWKVANVRVNREQAGKGRGLTRKQKDLRIQIPLSSLRLVQLHLDI